MATITWSFDANSYTGGSGTAWGTHNGTQFTEDFTTGTSDRILTVEGLNPFWGYGYSEACKFSALQLTCTWLVRNRDTTTKRAYGTIVFKRYYIDQYGNEQPIDSDWTNYQICYDDASAKTATFTDYTPSNWPASKYVRFGIRCKINGGNSGTLFGNLTGYLTVNMKAVRTIGCYVNYFDTGNTAVSTQTYSDNEKFFLPEVAYTGYWPLGWRDSSDNLYGVTEQVTSGSQDLVFYGRWNKMYHPRFFDRTGSLIYEYTSLVTTVDDYHQFTGYSLYNINTVDYDENNDRWYYCYGWYRTNANSIPTYTLNLTGLQSSGTSINVQDSLVTGGADSFGFYIDYYSIWNPSYYVTYYDNTTELRPANQGYPRESDTGRVHVQRYTNYPIVDNIEINNTVVSPQSLHNDKTFLGWSTTQNSANVNYVYGDTIPNLQNDITLYAVWENRASITFQENGTSLTSTDGTYGTSTSSSAIASSNGVYYYNQGNNVTNCSYTLTNEQFYIKEIEITNSDGTTTGLPSGTISDHGRTWSINTWSSSGKNVIINIVLARNLRVSFVIYQPNNTIANNESSSLFKIYKDFRSVITTSDSISPHISVMSTGFLNTGDTISFNPKCFDTNQRFYISKFIIPKSTKVNVPYWDGPGNTIDSTCYDEIAGVTAINNGNSVYPQITNNIYTEGLYSFTATANYMSSDMLNQNIIYIYAVYEPFNCQYIVCNHNYDPGGSAMIGYNDDYSSGHQTHLCIRSVNSTDYIYTYKFFNNVQIQSNWYIARFRNNNTTKSLAYGLYSFDIPQTQGFELQSVVDFGSVSGQNANYNYYPEPIALSNKPCDYICPFLGWEITPPQSALNTYNSPYYLYVNWSPNTYRCAIVIKLPSDKFHSETGPTMTEITDVITFDNNSDNNWRRSNKIIQHIAAEGNVIWNRQFNRIYLTKEFFPTDSTSSVNAVFRDIANSGYILKEIRKCSYNGDYAGTLSDTAITRNQLDAMTSTQATNTLAALNITRSSPDISTGSNDKITFSKSNLNNNPSIVDYYFITYEEGLPIFYPGDENDPKRAIQLFWEDTRAIGLYYENTRLL